MVSSLRMRVLIVEDQLLIGKAIRKGLREEGFIVDLATTVEEGTHLAREFEYDSLVLDLTLPDGSGLEVLKDIRQRNQRTPVLILTAKDTIEDKTQGYLHGTDDFLAKPFAFEELLLRIRALIRRKYQIYGTGLTAGPLSLDQIGRTASVNGVPLPLTSKEFAFLEFFLMKRGHVLSRQKICEHLYSGEEVQESNVVDVFINKLRRKLEAAGVSALIDTVRGEGYILR